MSKAPTVGAIKKALAKIEQKAKTRMQHEIRDRVEDIGTSLTVAKLRQPPLAQLIEAKLVGPDEQMAADEILDAYDAIARRVRVASPALERVSGSRPQPDLEALIHEGRHAEVLPWPARTAAVVARYQAFADHWAARAKRGDPTLGILIAAVVDETPIGGVNGIAYNEGLGPWRVRFAIIAGLRDYAVRAGMVVGGQAAKWRKAAAVFPAVEHPELAFSKVRAAQSAQATT